MRPATANEATLPKWAQERLEGYRRDLTDLQRKLFAVAEGTEKAPFFYEFFEQERVPFFYIPRHARLQHSDGHSVMEFQDCDSEWVKIYAHDGTLHVQPVAANVLKIKVERHRSPWDHKRKQ